MTSTQAAQHVRPDSYVTLHYRIELLTGPGAGTVFVDTFLDRPATLQMGIGQWAPGIEALLLDRPEGEQFTADLPAAQAYGERNPDLLRWVGRDEMARNAPPDTEFEAGDMVEFVAPNGKWQWLSEAIFLCTAGLVPDKPGTVQVDVFKLV